LGTTNIIDAKEILLGSLLIIAFGAMLLSTVV
jgi:hypothetical protein